MQIKEARGIYQSQIKSYRKTAYELRQKQKELEEKIKETPNGKVVYENEAVSLELSLNAVEKKQNEYQEYMEKLMDKWNNVEMLVSTEQQTDSMKEATEEQMKILEVARRLMKGAKVPQADEMKLMKFDSGLYQMAKSIGAMVQKEKQEKYDSLWDEEEEKDSQDPNEVADSAAAPVGAPDTVSAEMTAGMVE